MEPSALDETSAALSTSDTKREEGANFLRQGRFLEAANSLGEATEIDPSDEAAWRLLGGAFASQGDYSRAAAAFEQAIILAPTNARNNYNLGLALEALDRIGEARTAFEQALSLDPTYEAAQTRLSALGGSIADSYVAAPSPAFPIPPQMPNMSGSPVTEEPTPPPPSPASALDRPSYESPAPSQLSGIGFAPEPAISAFPPAGAVYVPQPVLGQGYDVSVNNSGMREGAPAEVAVGWNWGAFYFSWVWLMNHKLVGWGVGLLVVCFVPYLGGLVSLGAAIYLGIKGNELGWANRRFESIQDFKSCQNVWAKWALGWFIASFAIGLIAGILIVVAGGLANAGRH